MESIDKKILLVDDDKNFINLFNKIIKNEGYNVQVASTGKEALNMCGESKFDLLILDINLPDIMGGEVAKRIRNKDKKLGIIMITGYPHLQDSIDSLDVGVLDILLKPISSSEILRAINEAFKN